MQFRNLTPFHAMAYTGLDKQDQEQHVVVMAVGYQLKRRFPDATAFDPKSEIFDAVVMDDEPLPLCLADEHWGEPDSSSLKSESDLAPFKTKCDVLVQGKAYAVQSTQVFESRLRVSVGAQVLIDKTLHLTGPREFRRDGGLGGWLREGLNPTRAYTLSPPQACTSVDLRYELAYGGSSIVRHPKPRDGQDAFLMNEVCYRNPVGVGWMARGYFEALNQTADGLPAALRAPQITGTAQPFVHLIQTSQSGSINAAQMAQIDYQADAAGFGPLCKAWAPRLAKAGTYDDAWLKQRHPKLPHDFDFNYWNGAPQDQQMPSPDPSKGVLIETEGLRPGGRAMRVQLPPHRAFVLLRFHDGVMLPHPMRIDTITVQTDAPQGPILRVVWRTHFPDRADLALRVMEARFEVNPGAPLLKLQGVNA